jgi:hypothetical protein
MKKLLVVSPNFAPLNTPEMHRVRTSLPYFEDFGWQPYVLTVDSRYQSGVVEEPRLLNTVPTNVPIRRTGALPLGLMQTVGIRNIALRAFLHLYRAGAQIIAREAIDLVYISTTMFPAMALGRLWRARFGTPYVLDMQDPWVDDSNDSARQLPKARWARLLHGVLEPFTMRRVAGLIAVSSAYADTLRRRYPWISPDRCVTVPFGAATADFDEAARGTWQNPFFGNDGSIHGVYAGAVSPAMRTAARILFRALTKAQTLSPRAATVRLELVGTSYAGAGREQKALDAEAKEERVEERVREWPERIPYFNTLRLLRDSDFLIVLGSTASDYVPSKLFQYILAKRPIVAVVHEGSPTVDILRRSRAAVVATFRGADDIEGAADRLSHALAELCEGRLEAPDTDWSVVSRFDAAELTRQQCALFDLVAVTSIGNVQEIANAR